ncbi:MAG: CehA/McbA family metallohydrolase [Pirellulaceae bacterium]|nr:CehA/McbA family metallohydrolase [Pirellulaceae bacterium]
MRSLLPGVAGALLVTFAASWLSAHDHTAHLAERARQISLAAAARFAQPAPLPGDGQKTCRLTVEMMLEGEPAAIAGLLRVTSLASGKAIVFRDEILREQNWHALAPSTVLTVPREKLKIEALQGIETKLFTQEIDLAGKATETLQIKLQRLDHPARRGLVAGNTHLHLMKLTFAEADRYLRVVPRADGLQLVFLSHLRRIPDERDYISNTFTEGDLGRLSRGGVLFGNGQEHRHNFGPGGEGFGHVMLLNILKLIEPVSIGPGIMREGTDGIPLQRGIRQARGDGATVIWCHNTFGHEDLPNWVAGELHAQNIHDGGEHGTYEDTFYRYLNVGMKVPFSTGTDWFIYDFSRVYVPIEGEVTAAGWLQQLTAGKTFITNGPLLEFSAGGKAIGETIAATGGEEIEISGRAIGRGNFRRLELIHNGQVIHAATATAADGTHAATLKHRLALSEPGWLALRIAGDAENNEFGKPLFAHTSPIYVTVAGRSAFQVEVAGEMLAEMGQSREFVAKTAKFGDVGERTAVLRVYDEALAAWRKRIDSAHLPPR